MVDLSVFKTVDSLRERLRETRKVSSIGFVPTMGALHHGHVELVKLAAKQSDIVVVSIFVNPTQFNKEADLVNYPRNLENDLQLLESMENVLVFVPPVNEVYPDGFILTELELGLLQEVMEGEFRPGHFKGMMTVVKRFFEIIEPNYAFFGEKDYQQLAVVNYMVEQLKIPVEVVGCPTVREKSGLASSSRNFRLSESELVDSEIIFKTMDYARSLVHEHSVKEVAFLAKQFFNKGKLDLEYLEIVDPDSLEALNEWVSGARICIAACCGEVRLIDNSALTK